MNAVLRSSLLVLLVLLLPVTARAGQKDIPGPAGSEYFGSVHVLPNGNFVVIDEYATPAGKPLEAGAVYLYGPTGTLISRLTGSSVSDHIGSYGITVLANGNFVVLSPQWHSGNGQGAGAVTWGSATTGFSSVAGATVAAGPANSLVGSHADDVIGAYSDTSDIKPLPNGNYLVLSPGWDNEAAVDAGAVTWGDGTTGVSGVISAAISLVGSTANDRVGDITGENRLVVLGNGNYVLASPDWQNGSLNRAGAVTWGSGTAGVKGAVSAANSLVGAAANDGIGNGAGAGGAIVALSDGSYVVSSPDCYNPAIDNTGGFDPFTGYHMGAVTWCSGTTGRSGQVSAANSLVGYHSADAVGSGGMYVLPGGAFVVASPQWSKGNDANVGAVTWCGDGTGAVGVVAEANSLVGGQVNDRAGSGGVAVLTNGNYVVSSPGWANGAVSEVGAATWIIGTTGLIGAISPANSLVGSSQGDGNDQTVTALAQGNYVVSNPSWTHGTFSQAGAVTWGDGTTGLQGAVSTANSLVGGAEGDSVGTVTALTNGNYVVGASYWNNGAHTSAGAAAWCSGAGPTAATVSAANSLVGSSDSDFVGDEVTPLPNGNYLVSSTYWSNGSVSEAGHVTWCSGTAGLAGEVTPANSLVGSSKTDSVGYAPLVLSNGNYVVSTPGWDNPDASGHGEDVGAVTWGSGAAGITGPVSINNSLIGSTHQDRVGNGSGIQELADGNYVVSSVDWVNAEDSLNVTPTAGAATWCSGTAGRTGKVSSANSLVGGGLQRIMYVDVNKDGTYLAICSDLTFGSQGLHPSVTLCLAGGETLGAIRPENSFINTDTNNFDMAYDPVHGQIVIGNYLHNTVSLFTPTQDPPAVTPGSDPLGADEGTVVIHGHHFSPHAADNVVIFNNGVRGTVRIATATELTVDFDVALVVGPLTVVVKTAGVSSGKAVVIASVVPAIHVNTGVVGLTDTTFIIHGAGFSLVAGHNIVRFSNGVTGTVTHATGTELTVTLHGLVFGMLTVTIVVDGISSGNAVQVGTVQPVVSPSTTYLGPDSTTLIIYGSGFSLVPEENVVVFSGGAHGVVSACTATRLIITGLTGLSEGVLTVVITVHGVGTGGAVQVGTVIPSASGTLFFREQVITVNQDASSVVLHIDRGGSDTATAVTVHLIDGSASFLPYYIGAKAGVDYSGSVEIIINFAAGEVSRTVTIPLVVKSGLAVPNRRFGVQLTDPVGGSGLGGGGGTSVAVQILATDTLRPSVTIAAPASGLGLTTGTTTVSGTATDGKGVAGVQVSLNGGLFVDALLSAPSHGLVVGYSLGLTLVPGPNTVAVKSTDMRGNTSIVVTRNFSYVVYSPLSVVIDQNIGGKATVPLLVKADKYKLGFPYTLVAKPGVGQVFDGWTVNFTAGTGLTPVMLEVPGLTFIHQEGLILTAHFKLNPFIASLIGKFNGLVTPSAVLPAGGTPAGNRSVGSLTGSVSVSGGFTGTLKIDGTSVAVAGVFDNQGVARFGKARATSIVLARTGKPALEVTLALDMTGASGRITGTLTQHLPAAVTVVCGIEADRAFYSSTNKVEEALAGKASRAYTFVFRHLPPPPGLTTDEYPQGDGYATGSIRTDGTVSITGRLADHTVITASVPLSKAKTWPLFASLYGAQGCFAALMAVNDAAPATDVTGSGVYWFRPLLAVQWYHAGWPEGITTEVSGSKYAPPPGAVFPLAAAPDALNGNALLTFSGGLLPASPLVKQVNITATNTTARAPVADTTFTFVLTPASGLISGTLTPAAGAVKVSYQGVIFQKNPVPAAGGPVSKQGGYGYFMTAAPRVVTGLGQGGGVLLQAR